MRDIDDRLIDYAEGYKYIVEKDGHFLIVQTTQNKDGTFTHTVKNEGKSTIWFSLLHTLAPEVFGTATIVAGEGAIAELYGDEIRPYEVKL